jgi:hypothetical protein
MRRADSSGGTSAQVEPPLERGQLVLYWATSARWYFARVVTVRGGDVRLRWFDGSPVAWGPRDQVESLQAAFGNRQRRWSLRRAQLAFALFGREFERLPTPKLQQVQRVLRKAGISFEPAVWPTAGTRIRLQLERTAGRPRGKRLDPAVATLLPQWIEPFVLPHSSRDPLGLQAPAEKLVNEVLPGLTVFTFRAGYYGFLCWAIRTVNAMRGEELPGRSTRNDVLNAFERALVLCEFLHHGRDDDSCNLLGQRSKARLLDGGPRFGVPDRILKNQYSAGSFRLFATSLVSLRLADDAQELGADGQLPLRLTLLGTRLANAFAQCLDESRFISFALGPHTRAEDVLCGWGKTLCFSCIARRERFRNPLLDGLLLGNSQDAEKRYRTVKLLFDEGFLDGEAGDATQASDGIGEDDAGLLDEGDVQGRWLDSLDIVLHFYGCSWEADKRALQALAVFELLSLGLTAIFRAAVCWVNASTPVEICGLAESISKAGKHAAVWKLPMQDARPATARQLAHALFDCANGGGDLRGTEAAAIGGALLVRVLSDRLFGQVRDDIARSAGEALELVDWLRSQRHRSLAHALPELLQRMAERHKLVSERKNRQTWLLCEDGGKLARDDLHELGLALHALRFPQLGSLAHDLGLCEEHLHG